MSKDGQRWTPAEDALLRELYLTMSSEALGERFERKAAAVRNRCWVLGLNTKRAPEWTEEQLAALRELYETHRGRRLGADKFVKSLGKSNVSRKARTMGLTEPARQEAEIKHIRLGPGHYAKPKKYATESERRAAQSEKMKAYLAEHDHPRGALGMKHTDAAKEKMLMATRRWLNEVTPEEWKEITQRSVQTKLDRYGTAGPPNQGNAYSRCKRGRRADLGDAFFRSAWEANIARYLNLLQAKGEVLRWEYEAEVFRFEGVKRGPYTYTPDFKVWLAEEVVVYWEVKGWMDSASKSRLKRMKQHHPAVELVLIDRDRYQAIARIAGLIPEWE